MLRMFDLHYASCWAWFLGWVILDPMLDCVDVGLNVFTYVDDSWFGYFGKSSFDACVD